MSPLEKHSLIWGRHRFFPARPMGVSTFLPVGDVSVVRCHGNIKKMLNICCPWHDWKATHRKHFFSLHLQIFPDQSLEIWIFEYWIVNICEHQWIFEFWIQLWPFPASVKTWKSPWGGGPVWNYYSSVNWNTTIRIPTLPDSLETMPLI